MPHLLLEYSKNLTTHIYDSKLLHQLHKAVENSGLFPNSDVKSRSYGYDEVVITGDNLSFVHIVLMMLSGRNTETRKALAESLFKITKSSIPYTDKISVEIREMDAETYQKT